LTSAGGAALDACAMQHVLFPTDFGTCGLAWDDAGLAAFQLPEETEERTEATLAAKSGSRRAESDPPDWAAGAIARAQRHLRGDMQLFAGERIDWSRASEFQRAVYREALTIPPGSTRTYGEISRAIGLGPEGARAVGAALAANPWPLLVPCHRVVSSGDRMTGFSAPGGVRTKTRLLVLEGAELLSE
jgi:methylated-DNA-[protein]-cysteine S-methyltransferase